MVAELKKPMTETEFLNYLKEKMDVSMIRHSKLTNKTIKNIPKL